MQVDEFTVTLDEPNLPVTAQDRASEPCSNCHQRWVLAMDDCGICPSCGYVNTQVDPEIPSPALEFFNHDATPIEPGDPREAFQRHHPDWQRLHAAERYCVCGAGPFPNVADMAAHSFHEFNRMTGEGNGS
ncbi:MAG: hypothetical protein KGJ86_16995 [Chloroflexota bacterium]|nr:hypothetical protein [Chloroflexota bacterium]